MGLLLNSLNDSGIVQIVYVKLVHDCVHDSIIKDPEQDIEMILQDIRGRVASFGVKNGTKALNMTIKRKW
jgi:hypothetical protein